jgi:hypothetical protein
MENNANQELNTASSTPTEIFRRKNVDHVSFLQSPCFFGFLVTDPYPKNMRSREGERIGFASKQQTSSTIIYEDFCM